MQPINSIPVQTFSAPSLDAFARGASQSDQLQAVVVDGKTHTVQAFGQLQTANGQRSVAWVQSDVDTTALFMQAFGASFGGRLSAAVSAELGLEPSLGKPLASRLVIQALDMAQTGQQAFLGIDFLTQLAHSASTGGAAFKAIAADMAIPPAALTDTSRRDIDARMALRFEVAVTNGQTPVSASQADKWLRTELTATATNMPGASYPPQQRV